MEGRSDVMALSSPTLLANVRETRKATFMERSDIEYDASGLKEGLISTDRTRLRSRWGAMGCTDGKVLMRLFQNLAANE